MEESYYSTDYNILYNLINQRVKNNEWFVKRIWTISKWKIFRYVTTHYVTFIKNIKLPILEFNWGPVTEKEVTIPLTKEE